MNLKLFIFFLFFSFYFFFFDFQRRVTRFRSKQKLRKFFLYIFLSRSRIFRAILACAHARWIFCYGEFTFSRTHTVEIRLLHSREPVQNESGRRSYEIVKNFLSFYFCVIRNALLLLFSAFIFSYYCLFHFVSFRDV